MKDQGHDEPEGGAKITPGYNLPAKFILHTVGPAINEHLTESDADLLAQSYLSQSQYVKKIIFNVDQDDEAAIYHELLH